MRLDTYTKMVLTVIAVCLVWICARDITVTRTVEAQMGSKVILSGADAPIPVVIQGIKRGKNVVGQDLPWEKLPVSPSN